MAREGDSDEGPLIRDGNACICTEPTLNDYLFRHNYTFLKSDNPTCGHLSVDHAACHILPYALSAILASLLFLYSHQLVGDESRLPITR
jgi:hypothetical protein